MIHSMAMARIYINGDAGDDELFGDGNDDTMMSYQDMGLLVH